MSSGIQSKSINFNSGRNILLAGAVAAVVGLLGSSNALAQNCGPTTFLGANAVAPVSAGLAGANVIAGSIMAAQTAFLTQSTAFVSAPANPAPNSEGGGIWTRGVGGSLNLNTGQTGSLQLTNPGLNLSGSTTCNTSFHQNFGGVQIGSDVAKLNINGWNLHLGTTAGFLETNGFLQNGNLLGGGFNSTTQAPFVGTYAVATKGGFFIDGMIRWDYYQTSLDSPSLNLFNQKVDAHGMSFNASAGYHWDVPNSQWFIEPGVGVVWSHTSVDAFNTASPAFGVNFSGTTQINDLNSLIGRAGLRFGTTVTTGNLVLQPFASVSVWHDFDKDYSANYASCAGCFFVFGVPSSFTATATTQNIGTFGQYSLGISGQIINTGWLGFARVDYRDGNRMEGLSATGGIRYQFTPTEVASKMLVKAPVIADVPVNWTGWYIGANTGGNYGHSSIVFPGVSSSEEHSAGFFAGGTLGYNYQVGNWVYGLEGDVSWTNTRASSQCAPLTDTTPGAGGFSVQTQLFQMTCHDNLDWTATAAARLGYLWGPRTLLYVKAGGAFGSETASMSCNLGPINGTPAQGGLQNCVNPALVVVNRASASDVRAGWTAGFGTEFALTQRWFATGEFDYIDFGTKSLTLNDGTLISSTQRVAQGKIGLNYKFSP